MKTISPKAEFIVTPEAIRFAELIAAPEMQQGIRVAHQQFVMNQNRGNTWEEASRQHYELQGVRTFIDLLLNLASPSAELPEKPKTNLTWQTPSQLKALRQKKA